MNPKGNEFWFELSRGREIEGLTLYYENVNSAILHKHMPYSVYAYSNSKASLPHNKRMNYYTRHYHDHDSAITVLSDCFC